MKEELVDSYTGIWNRLVKASNEYSLVLREFLALEESKRVMLMHQALRGPGRHTSLIILGYLDVADLKELFEDLVFLASFSHGAINTVREAILTLPREWVLERIEQVAEPFLLTDDSEEYRRILELYFELSPQMTHKLAQRALKNPNEEIQEAGQDFLDRLSADIKLS